MITVTLPGFVGTDPTQNGLRYTLALVTPGNCLMNVWASPLLLPATSFLMFAALIFGPTTAVANNDTCSLPLAELTTPKVPPERPSLVIVWLAVLIWPSTL